MVRLVKVLASPEVLRSPASGAFPAVLSLFSLNVSFFRPRHMIKSVIWIIHVDVARVNTSFIFSLWYKMSYALI